MKISYEMHTALQYRCQHAERRVKELESGEAFRKAEKTKAILRKYYDRKVPKRGWIPCGKKSEGWSANWQRNAVRERSSEKS